MRSVIPCLLVASVLASGVLARSLADAAQTASRVAAAPSVQPFASPAGIDSEGPNLSVTGDRVVLSWVERHEAHVTVKFADRTAAGWTASRTVVSGTDVMANAADVPVVRALADGSLVAAWPSMPGEREGYDLRLAWSKDGATWTTPVIPHKNDPEAQHGFVSLFPMNGGGFGLVWLDGRETAGMTLRSAEYGPDRVKRNEMSVDARVCECCPTSAASTSEGPVVVYRDRGADEVRDIAITRLAGGKWTPPVIVHRDGWKITGCPVNGPSISARGHDVAVAWFTGASGTGQALAAFSSDGGRTFGAPIRVDDGVAIGRVQISMLAEGSAVVSWIESLKPGSQFKVRRLERNGTRSPSARVAEGLGSTHPRMAFGRGELLLAWVEYTRGTTRIRTARIM